ncbi:nuclease-related domain-containing protein [Psychrobacter proteolyticus]|uniref:nuclease-related domain-containing protein n=1 Tax=Psychrobacter proteolyticus TaxID=147825 RepID=UPI003D05FA67
MSLKSSFKGFLGETVINVAMWLKLEKDVYHRLNGITLPRANGGSTQIDHIIVSVYGIFVIETKTIKAGYMVARTKDSGHKFSKMEVNSNSKIHCVKTTCTLRRSQIY